MHIFTFISIALNIAEFFFLMHIGYQKRHETKAHFLHHIKDHECTRSVEGRKKIAKNKRRRQRSILGFKRNSLGRLLKRRNARIQVEID